MSKLQSDILDQAVADMLAFSAGTTIQKDGADLKGKKRNFMESVELQVILAGWRRVWQHRPADAATCREAVHVLGRGGGSVQPGCCPPHRDHLCGRKLLFLLSLALAMWLGGGMLATGLRLREGCRSGSYTVQGWCVWWTQTSTGGTLPHEVAGLQHMRDCRVSSVRPVLYHPCRTVSNTSHKVHI
jgi:hypothetical protein